MKLDDFVIAADRSLYEALEKIDYNKKGFVVVRDRDGTAAGTLTDGDIRRALIGGAGLDAPAAAAACTDFSSVRTDGKFEDVIEVFKTRSIDFLPVLDGDGKLANLILKKAMHALMLKNIHPALDMDFINVDESVIDFEIFQRPWGFYKTTVLNDLYQSKVISVRPGASLSLQLHRRREEHWIIVSGTGLVRIGDSETEVTGGRYIFIPRGTKHRIRNTSQSETLVLIEVQRGQYFGEEDIVRLEDEYGRA
ncbi:MAG: cupin domain-containing protein [Anaerovoracaceae bacterium]|jgi:mannose-1-phosphate guanylyltransferase/mannose-6-phosphate isomerase